MLEKSDVAEPLRGFEFLAYLENGGAAAEGSALNTEKEHDNEENDEDDEDDEESDSDEAPEVADEVDGAAQAQSTFTSNFLGVKH
jgi:hypothetical protein